jgi:fumarate hydratase class II
MDATPVRAGQVFAGYAAQAGRAVERVERAIRALEELPIGGTAVGTGINTHPAFGRRVAAELSRRTGLRFREAADHFEAQGAKDAFVEASGELKVVAISLSKIANDIRLLGSGPRTGIGELVLPALQPGSSIMPGKVNPVLCESVVQVAAQVVGNDATIALAGFGGVGSVLELNVAMPVMADRMLDSIGLLARATRVFTTRLVEGLAVDRGRCGELIEKSLMMVTALAPELGYERAAALAKEAAATGRPIRALALEQGLLDPARLRALLDPKSMTAPSRPRRARRRP